MSTCASRTRRSGASSTAGRSSSSFRSGTIAAVAVAFARFLGVLAPSISPTAWIVAPIRISANYAVSLSWQQVIAILLIVLLTAVNTRGLQLAKLIQNVFTSAKTLALVALVLVGVLLGRNSAAISANFSSLWANQGAQPIAPGADFLRGIIPTVSATAGFFGLFVAFGVAQVGSLFSADAWNNITFTAGEVKNPRRDVPLSLALGTAIVISLYFLANVAYLVTLPLAKIQVAPDDRISRALVGWRESVILAGEEIYGKLQNMCIWNKTNAGTDARAGSLYLPRHELVFVFKVGGDADINNVALGRHGRNRANVWDYRGPDMPEAAAKGKLAPSSGTKPVAMVADAIRDCSSG